MTHDDAEARARDVVCWIGQHATRTPDRVALVDALSGHQWTYRQLHLRMRSVAYWLHESLGVEPGNRVALLAHNDPRSFEVLYACALLGAICVPLNWRLSTEELVGIVRDAEPAVLISDVDAASNVAGIAATVHVPHYLTWQPLSVGQQDCPREQAVDPGAAGAQYESLARVPAPPAWVPAPVGEDAPWLIIYTSGTTGVPKGVVRTHRNVVASIMGIVLAGQVSSTSCCLTVLPTFHVAGLDLFANPVLLLGGTVLIMREFDPHRTADLLTGASFPVTHFCGVPANFQALQRYPQVRRDHLRPFTAVVGGAPVPTTLVEDWGDRGVQLMTVFGITEAGACVTASSVDSDHVEPGTVGRPLLHARCRVQTSEATPAEPGQVGELQINGAIVTPGYWRNPEATQATISPDGWLKTGDAAKLQDGQLVLVDRWKDMYISGGENVYPAEVENTLCAHPDVAQAAVIGVPDPKWGETGVAFLVPTPNTAVEPDQVRQWCAENIARYKAPHRLHIVDDLPRNATGKIVKARLRDWDFALQDQ